MSRTFVVRLIDEGKIPARLAGTHRRLRAADVLAYQARREARLQYYDHLLITSQQGDLMPWLTFFLRGVRRQARDAEERTVRLVELQHQMRNDLLGEGRSNSIVRLAERLFSMPVITPARAETLLGVTRPTAQAAIEALVARGDLIETSGRERGRIYEAPRIFEAVYGKVEIPESAHDRQVSLDL